MTRFLSPLLALIVAFSFAACGHDEHDDDHGHEHGHGESEGPHGGTLVDVGDHEAHLEIIVDHDKRAVMIHFLTLENEPSMLKEAPLLNLKFASGPKSLVGKAVDGGAAGASEWHFRDDALASEPESGRFKIQWNGKTYNPDFEHSHEHGHEHGEDHDHEHGEEHGHGPHDGELAHLHDASDNEVGRIELKLHDDKGDLELWLTQDAEGKRPLDLPLDAIVHVTFAAPDRSVELRVRNTEQNEDEDGTATVRDGKTNYFIFPGASGSDASWLVGADFHAQVTIHFERGGTPHQTGSFLLVPHGAGDHGHDHDHGHEEDEDHDHDEGHEHD